MSEPLPSSNRAPVTEGDVLAGKYRVDKVLGVGGMGVVVAAHHIHLDERVALKFLLPEVATNAEVVARFIREARAAVRIKSEHVARVSDVGTLDSGAPYMVMEYLDGDDLEAWLETRGPLPVEQAVDFVLQTIEAIAEAHALGIVHRDLKPANLFVIRRPDGSLSIKVLDFGISKATGQAAGSGMSLTRTSAMMGSPLYMSPEQLENAKGVDARADVWALGAVLYELLTGRVPFEASSLPELLTKVLTAPHPPMTTLRPDLPAELERVVTRCLEKDRSRRYGDVAELAVALYPHGRHGRISVERASRVIAAAGLAATALDRAPASGSDSTSPGASTAGAWGQTSVPGRRSGSNTGWWLLGMVLAGSGVGAAFAATRYLSDAATSDAASTASAGAGGRSTATSEATARPAEPMASATEGSSGLGRPALTTGGYGPTESSSPAPDRRQDPQRAPRRSPATVASPRAAPDSASAAVSEPSRSPAPTATVTPKPAPTKPRAVPKPAPHEEPAGTPPAPSAPTASDLFSDRK